MASSTFTGMAANLDWNGVLRDKNTNAIIHTNWSGGGNFDYIPTAADDLNIGFFAPGNWAVFITGNDPNNQPDAADSLTIDGGNSLTMSATLTLGAGTTNGGTGLANTGTININGTELSVAGNTTNAGTINVNGGATLSLAGTVTGSGPITLTAGPNGVDRSLLLIDTAGASFSGGGFITLTGSNYFYDEITGSSTTITATLHNINDTIDGKGTVGRGGTINDPQFLLALDNQLNGTVNADASNALSLQNMTIANAGLLEATGTGGLSLTNDTITQSSVGMINGNNSAVTLTSVTLTGGILTTSGGGLVQALGNANILDGTVAGGIINLGTLTIGSGSTELVKGTLHNNATITLEAGPNGVDRSLFEVDTGGVTLDGGGFITLTGPNYFYDEITGSSAMTAATLHNVHNTLDGAGTIGSGGTINDPLFVLNLDNQVNGTVTADTAHALALRNLTVTNAGKLMTTAIGGLLMVNDTVTQAAGGVIQAVGADAIVTLTTVTIAGGIVAGLNGGAVQVVGTATLDGSGADGITTQGTFNITSGSITTLKGAIHNSGTFTLTAGGNASDRALLEIDTADATLDAGGTINMTGPSFFYNEITGTSTTTAATLHNAGTIMGAGTIGFGVLNGPSFLLSLDNQAGGIVNANSGNQLVLRNLTAANAGTIETTGSNLLIASTTINQTGKGAISAIGTGSTVDLDNVTIAGGLLSTTGTGTFEVAGTTPVLDGSTPTFGAITNAGSFLIGSGATLLMKGTVHNTGKVTVQAGGNGVDRALLLVDTTNVSLDGSGAIDLAGPNWFYDEITGVSTTIAATLHNASTLSGAGTVGKGGTINDPNNLLVLDNQAGGTVDATRAGLTLTLNTGATITNNGILEANGGTLVVKDSVTGTGSALITGGGTLSFDLGTKFQQDVAFSGAGRLNLPEASASAGGYIGHISGWGSTDTVDVNPLAFKSSYQVLIGQGSGSNQSLFVVDSANKNALVAQMNLTGSYVAGNFVLSDDNGGGMLISEQPVCFCRGTLILTERGEVAVEDLAVGDRMVTPSGALKPIVWIGLGRDLVTRANKLARPVIVRRGALADGVPARDLYLTHGHALYLDSAIGGVLIPVENLVNHRSIVWDEAARVVEYYHIELEDHDVLLANGAPAESYYDAGNRAMFHNTRPESLAGGATPTFAPVLTGGDVVEQVWATLFKRSGGRFETDTTDDPDLHLVVDGVRLGPATVDGGLYSFALSAPPAATVQLRSRSGVPSLLGVTAHDHRKLGVAISRITLRQPGGETVIEPEAPLLLTGGCHPPEQGYCWTDGELELPLHLFAHLASPLTVAVRTERPGMRYPLPPAVAAAA